MSEKNCNFASQNVKHNYEMEQYPYSIEELRAGVEEATRQVEAGQYYTNAQVNNMLKRHHSMVA